MQVVLNQIIVHCPRDGTSHARISIFDRCIKIEYGRTYDAFASPFLPNGQPEILRFEDHPELRELYQDFAWNTRALDEFFTPHDAYGLVAEDMAAPV